MSLRPWEVEGAPRLPQNLIRHKPDLDEVETAHHPSHVVLYADMPLETASGLVQRLFAHLADCHHEGQVNDSPTTWGGAPEYE